MRVGRPSTDDDKKGSFDPISIERAAKLMNVTPTSINRAKKRMKDDPDGHAKAKEPVFVQYENDPPSATVDERSAP